MKPFVLTPYKGAEPIAFGMTPSDVASILGPPEDVGRNDLGERSETRNGISIRYSQEGEKVVEIGFVPGTRLLFDGRSLLDENDLIDVLIEHDPIPYEFVGFLIFFGLGITVTGFHDEDESQKAITVFREGRWDEYRQEAVPWQRPE